MSFAFVAGKMKKVESLVFRRARVSRKKVKKKNACFLSIIIKIVFNCGKITFHTRFLTL